MESALVNKKELKHNRVLDEITKKDIKVITAPALISEVPPWSLAKQLGLQSGDKILEINGQGLRDIFDFELQFKKSEDLELLIKRGSEELIFEIEKDYDDELGAVFATPLFNGVQECANKCPFCFVENQPLDQTRETLQIRDDDFRLSYFHGSYITLTNLSFSDRKRIEELRPGPLYISVHATDPTVRNLMLGRKKSNPILDELKWLGSLGIPVHTQIVLCPEMNDGDHLLKTISELHLLKKNPVESVAVVPVGLTKYHRGGLRRFTIDELFEVINLVENWQNQDVKSRKNFVFLSDEFYLMTHTPVPNQDYYGDYPQLEDGVGMTRLFLNEIDQELKQIKKLKYKNPKVSLKNTSGKVFLKAKTKIAWINGTISKPIVEQVAIKINQTIPFVDLKAFCIESLFWGLTNVSGLLTGNDIYQALRYIPKEMIGELIIIPSVMLKEGSDIFLDDMHISELEKKLGIKCQKAWGAKELINLLIQTPQQLVASDNLDQALR
jgi:putative radical SAM enzyme (TIGR03279 family)